jgi:hypothetical protein
MLLLAVILRVSLLCYSQSSLPSSYRLLLECAVFLWRLELLVPDLREMREVRGQV